MLVDFRGLIGIIMFEKILFFVWFRSFFIIFKEGKDKFKGVFTRVNVFVN